MIRERTSNHLAWTSVSLCLCLWETVNKADEMPVCAAWTSGEQLQTAQA